MKNVVFFSILLISLILSSCVQLKPFKVGNNIDIKNRIIYMDNLEQTMHSIAKQICKDNITNIAINNFIDTLNKRVTDDGKYLALDLKNKLWQLCRAKTTIINNSQWLKQTANNTIIKPHGNFSYFIYGTYEYTYRGYAMFVKLINIKTKTNIKLFAEKICNKKAIFDIDALHIPQEIVIEPLW